MITSILALNETDPEKLREVKSYMLNNGAPTIRYINNGNGNFAIEGSHRIQAALELGIVPVFVEIDGDSPVWGHDLDSLKDGCSGFEIIVESDQIEFSFDLLL